MYLSVQESRTVRQVPRTFLAIEKGTWWLCFFPTIVKIELPNVDSYPRAHNVERVGGEVLGPRGLSQSFLISHNLLADPPN